MRLSELICAAALDEAWVSTTHGFMRWFRRVITNLFTWERVPVLILSLASCQTGPISSPHVLYWASEVSLISQILRQCNSASSQSAGCPVPPFMFLCLQLSRGSQSGLVLMLFCLSAFVGRMIRTTPSSRLKALASPCQPAERLQ